MKSALWAKRLWWMAGIVAVIGAIVAWRFYATAPVLRFAHEEALVASLPYVVLLLVVVGLLVREKARGNSE